MTDRRPDLSLGPLEYVPYPLPHTAMQTHTHMQTHSLSQSVTHTHTHLHAFIQTHTHMQTHSLTQSVTLTHTLIVAPSHHACKHRSFTHQFTVHTHRFSLLLSFIRIL